VLPLADRIRVVLADDHPLILAGIRISMSISPDLWVVGQAIDGWEAQETCRKMQPDVLVLDLTMPGPGPDEVVACLREHCPQTKILVLTAHKEYVHAQGMKEAGVQGYALKDEGPEIVAEAIRAVASGGQWFRSLEMIRQESGPDSLSKREQEILARVSMGWSNATMGKDMGLAESTVKNCLSVIYDKIDLVSRSRSALITWCKEHGY